MAVKTSKPKLIEESRIRRWGQIANINKYTKKFLKENFGDEEEMSPEGAEMPAGDEEMPADTEEMPPEDDAGESVPEPQVQDLVKAIADAITAQTGVAVEVEGSSGDMGGEEIPPEDSEMSAGDEEMPPEESPMGEGEFDSSVSRDAQNGALQTAISNLEALLGQTQDEAEQAKTNS